MFRVLTLTPKAMGDDYYYHLFMMYLLWCNETGNMEMENEGAGLDTMYQDEALLANHNDASTIDQHSTKRFIALTSHNV